MLVLVISGWSVLAFGAPQLTEALQNTTTEWKTFVAPKLGLSIDYPPMPYTVIHEDNETSSVAIVGDFEVTIDHIKYNSTEEFKQQVIDTINEYNDRLNQTILQDIRPISYLNISGYALTTAIHSPYSDNTFIRRYALPNATT